MIHECGREEVFPEPTGLEECLAKNLSSFSKRAPSTRAKRARGSKSASMAFQQETDCLGQYRNYALSQIVTLTNARDVRPDT
jgi:hypothetical protein